MILTALTLIGESLKMGALMFWETLWALILGFGLSGAVQAFVSRSEMERALGKRDLEALAKATGFGCISSSCSYAASAMAKSLFQKGADFTSSMVFMFASTNLVLELGIVLWVLMGWQFAAAEFIGGFIMIGLLASLSRFAFKPDAIEGARARLSGSDGRGRDDSDAVGGPASWRQRLGSLAGWSDAASYTLADVTMLRRELVIGFVIAGFLDVLVPRAFWNTFFLTGHGAWTSIENAIVGPFVAIISFVCSIGNVPLAAALWAGGISFGGVVSFVFADLISLPLLLIYRRYYGTPLTLRLLAVFWLVMSAAGLVTEVIFAGAGIVPTSREAAMAGAGFSWNYTAFLNIIFLVLFAGLWWLARNRARFGGGAGYAIDPVCGMQVQTANAPARATFEGQIYYFCSDHCRERFQRQPDKYTGGTPAVEHEHSHTQESDTAIDPVCHMTVEKATAAATRVHNGETYYFCMTGCAVAFEKEPEKYLTAGHA